MQNIEFSTSLLSGELTNGFFWSNKTTDPSSPVSTQRLWKKEMYIGSFLYVCWTFIKQKGTFRLMYCSPFTSKRQELLSSLFHTKQQFDFVSVEGQVESSQLYLRFSTMTNNWYCIEFSFPIRALEIKVPDSESWIDAFKYKTEPIETISTLSIRPSQNRIQRFLTLHIEEEEKNGVHLVIGSEHSFSFDELCRFFESMNAETTCQPYLCYDVYTRCLHMEIIGVSKEKLLQKEEVQMYHLTIR